METDIQSVESLCKQSRYKEAAAICEKEIQNKSINTYYYSILGGIYASYGKYNKALEIINQGLLIDEKNIKLLNNGGVCLYRLKKYLEAEAFYKKAISINQQYKDAYVNLGNVYASICEHGKASETYRNAIRIGGADAATQSNLILNLLYDGAAKECYIESLKFGRTFNVLKKYDWKIRHANKKLKIGFVTADLNRHPVSNFMMPIFKEIDKKKFELIVFNLSLISDEITDLFINMADLWHNVSGISEDRIAELIYENKIDILFDLAGHTGNNKILIFKSKPAPIQVSYLGYPATTGIKEIDYRLTDRYMDPQKLTEGKYVESLWRLDSIFCSYQALHGVSDDITELPAINNGYTTYGVCANISKYSDKLIKAWALLSRKDPNSKFIFEIAGVEDKLIYSKMHRKLIANGFQADRITITERKPNTQYLLYKNIDISLDTFPLVGGTTSFDSLWMGVPFVTLAGSESSSRMGASLLKNAGLTDLITENAEDYVAKIVVLSSDTNRLMELRKNLRHKLINTPIFNGKKFTKEFEDALIEMQNNKATQ